jgi:hypothetical protein
MPKFLVPRAPFPDFEGLSNQRMMVRGTLVFIYPGQSIDGIAGTDGQAFVAIQADIVFEPGPDSQRFDVREANGPSGAKIKASSATDTEPPVDDILDSMNGSHQVYPMLFPRAFHSWRRNRNGGSFSGRSKPCGQAPSGNGIDCSHDQHSQGVGFCNEAE